jgi:hypothetical protein
LLGCSVGLLIRLVGWFGRFGWLVGWLVQLVGWLVQLVGLLDGSFDSVGSVGWLVQLVG